MYANYEMSAQIERRARERAFLSAAGDPERAWAARERRERSIVKIELGGAARSLRAIALAVLGLFF